MKFALVLDIRTQIRMVYGVRGREHVRLGGRQSKQCKDKEHLDEGLHITYHSRCF